MSRYGTIPKDQENFSWKEVAKSIWFFLDKDRGKFTVFFFVLLSIFFYDFVPPYLVGKIIDFLTTYTKGDALGPFYLFVGIAGVTWIIASLIRLYSKNKLGIIGQNARGRARSWGFERLTEFSLEWHAKENTGNKLQRIFTGADAINNSTKILRRDLLKFVANIIGVSIAFVVADYKLILLVVVYVALFFFCELRLSRRVFFLSNEFNKLNQSAGGVYVETANNMLSIKALGGEKTMTSRVADRETLSRDIAIKKINANNFKWRIFQVINGIALIAFLLIVGFSGMKGAITVGTVLVLFTYFTKLGTSLADMSDLYSELLDLRSDVGHMMPIFREVEKIERGNEKFPTDWKSMDIKNASMDYGSGQNGIKDFTLRVGRGQKIGIAGLSGSGKSTFAKIILGLYKIKSGKFLVGNQDYYSISHQEMLSNITVVLQEAELFNLTLRENITMMRPEDPKLLAQAIEVSEMGSIINKLPAGLDTLIGEKGYMLSGGERQRLGIARAVYKNTPIVILDEATSALDATTENRVMEKLFGIYGKEKTFILIAHRIGTLRYVDSIAVVDGGKVAETGTYDELMKNSGSLFAKINQKQKAGGESKAPEVSSSLQSIPIRKIRESKTEKSKKV